MPKHMTATFDSRAAAAAWLDEVREETQGNFTHHFKLNRAETALPLPEKCGVTISGKSFYWAHSEDCEPTHTPSDLTREIRAICL
jgi:hypothetical protein